MVWLIDSLRLVGGDVVVKLSDHGPFGSLGAIAFFARPPPLPPAEIERELARLVGRALPGATTRAEARAAAQRLISRPPPPTSEELAGYLFV